MLSAMMGNWWTTLIGFIGGVAYYLGQSGATMPSTKAEWINLLIGALLAGLGLASKDATTGSKPKA